MDYTPVVSTLTNLGALFAKCVQYLKPEMKLEDHYFTHMKNKDLQRCVILLVPFVGNFFVFILDINEKSRKSCKNIKETFRSLENDIILLGEYLKDKAKIECESLRNVNERLQKTLERNKKKLVKGSLMMKFPKKLLGHI